MATTSARRNRTQLATGLRFLLIGGILAVAGAVLTFVLDDGTPAGIGVALLSLATIPTVAGLALLGSALVEKRSREGKPFA